MSGWTLVPTSTSPGWTPVPETPPEPPAKGGWEGVKRGLSNMAHMPGAILDAITKPPQNDEEEQMHTLGGPGALAIHRLIAAPMAQQHELAKKYQTQATGNTETPPEKLGFDFSLTGSTPQEKAQHLANLHHIASVVPLLGPMVGDLTERFLGIGEHEGNPDKSGALAEGATYVAAPEVAKGLLKATPAAASAVGKALPEAVKNYTPSGNVPELLKRTALGQTLGRLPASSMVEQLTGSKALVRPTLKDWWQALQPDKQMSLFKSMPKLGDTPISPETHPATVNFLQEQAAPETTKPFQAGGSTVPRVSSGEAVINDALTSLDKPTLMRIANSRGINTTTEANLIPSKAEASLVKKIKADMTFDELADAREVGLEATRNKPVPGENLGKKAMQEAWHYKVVKQFFPDVDLPAAMEKRAQATIAKRPSSADYTPIYRAAAQKASPSGATDAEVNAKAENLQAQDQNMEALLRESIAQAEAKKAAGAGGKTEETATAEGRSAQAEAARAGAKYMNPSPKGKGQAQTPIEETEEGARMIRERTARDAQRKIDLNAPPGQRVIPPDTTAQASRAGSQLQQPESGADWYGKDIKRTEAAIQQIHPELSDPAQMTLFKAMNAGTSLGNKSAPAIENALDVYDSYKKTGKVPLVNPETGKGWPNGQYNAYQNTFKTLQSLIDSKGEQAAAQWLTEKHPISELRQFNKNVAGKMADEEYGALALGPKAGPFFLNMSGVEGKLTADVWFTRTWNRWMGTMKEGGELVEAPRNENERAMMGEAIKILAERHGLSTRDAQAVLWNYEQRLYTKHGIPSEQPSYGTAAETVVEKRLGKGKPKTNRPPD